MPRPEAHPAFAPFGRWLARCRDGGLPDHATLNAWAREVGLALPDGRPLAFVIPPPRRMRAHAYEGRVAERSEIVVRADNLHDACNALVWLTLPRTKAALNALHVDASLAPPALRGGTRGRVRDAATLLDESGMLVACTDKSLVDLWRRHAWREAFLGRSASDVRVVTIGHGVLAKCAVPFRAITARALVLALDPPALPEGPDVLAAALDNMASARLAGARAAFASGDLLPLPVAALPGWDTEILGARLYDDVSVFRSRRHSRSTGGVDVLR